MYLQGIVKYQHLDKGSVWDNGGTEKNTCPLCQYRGEDRVKKTQTRSLREASLLSEAYILLYTGPWK